MSHVTWHITTMSHDTSQQCHMTHHNNVTWHITPMSHDTSHQCHNTTTLHHQQYLIISNSTQNHWLYHVCGCVCINLYVSYCINLCVWSCWSLQCVFDVLQKHQFGTKFRKKSRSPPTHHKATVSYSTTAVVNQGYEFTWEITRYHVT